MYNLLLGDPMQNKNLWDNVKKMNEIRKLYNQIVITKFRHLPKQIRRLPHIVKLFDQAKAMLDVIDAKNKEIKGTIKLAVSEIDNEKALNTEREEAFLK